MVVVIMVNDLYKGTMHWYGSCAIVMISLAVKQ